MSWAARGQGDLCPFSWLGMMPCMGMNGILVTAVVSLQNVVTLILVIYRNSSTVLMRHTVVSTVISSDHFQSIETL